MGGILGLGAGISFVFLFSTKSFHLNFKFVRFFFLFLPWLQFLRCFLSGLREWPTGGVAFVYLAYSRDPSVSFLPLHTCLSSCTICNLNSCWLPSRPASIVISRSIAVTFPHPFSLLFFYTLLLPLPSHISGFYCTL